MLLCISVDVHDSSMVVLSQNTLFNYNEITRLQTELQFDSMLECIRIHNEKKELMYKYNHCRILRTNAFSDPFYLLYYSICNYLGLKINLLEKDFNYIFSLDIIYFILRSILYIFLVIVFIFLSRLVLSTVCTITRYHAHFEHLLPNANLYYSILDDIRPVYTKFISAISSIFCILFWSAFVNFRFTKEVKSVVQVVPVHTDPLRLDSGLVNTVQLSTKVDTVKLNTTQVENNRCYVEKTRFKRATGLSHLI